MARLRTAILLAALSTGLTFGDTIISDLCCNGTSGASGGSIAVSWTQTGTFANVGIGANLATDNGNGISTGTAYLMNAIGPGATSANEVTAPFSISVNNNPGVNVLTPLFSGLTLGPGTYYLVVVPTTVNQTTSLVWDGTSIPVQILDTGVTQGAEDFLAGSFNSTETATSNFYNFAVTGTPQATQASAPEPGTSYLLLGGLGIFAAVKVARRAAAY